MYFCIAAVALVTVVGALFVQRRLSQVDAGVCVKEGRVLSKEELRQAVLQNFIDIEQENFRIWYYDVTNYSSRVGIIRNPKDTDIRYLIDQAYLGDKSFTENFGIDEFKPEQTIQISKIREPFMLVFYGFEPNELSSFYISTEIQPIDDPMKIEFFQKPYTPGVYDSLRGFGKHYFRFSYTMVDKICCGNEIPREWSREKQLIKKEKAYRSLIFHDGLLTHKNFVPVSNCGELLTSRAPNGWGYKIHWFSGG